LTRDQKFEAIVNLSESLLLSQYDNKDFDRILKEIIGTIRVEAYTSAFNTARDHGDNDIWRITLNCALNPPPPPLPPSPQEQKTKEKKQKRKSSVVPKTVNNNVTIRQCIERIQTEALRHKLLDAYEKGNDGSVVVFLELLDSKKHDETVVSRYFDIIHQFLDGPNLHYDYRPVDRINEKAHMKDTVDLTTFNVKYRIEQSDMNKDMFKVVASEDIDKQNKVMVVYGECYQVSDFVKEFGSKCLTTSPDLTVSQINHKIANDEIGVCHYFEDHIWILRSFSIWVQQHCDKNNIGKLKNKTFKKRKRTGSEAKESIRSFLKHSVCRVNGHYRLCFEPIKKIPKGSVLNVDWSIKEYPKELEPYICRVACECSRCTDCILGTKQRSTLQLLLIRI
jgi:hypothetical protein